MRVSLNQVLTSFSQQFRSHASRRRRANPFTRTVEILEERTLLSAVADPGLEGVDAFGNTYDALPELPDEYAADLGPADGTGNFDGTGTIADLSQTFFLNSDPGAAQTIYLDFNGEVTSGTSWNSAFTGGANIVTPAYSMDSDPAFSNTELAAIQGIWQRVAEDFLPFDVNVTTQDPGSAALAKSGSSDAAWGVRVVIGGDGTWYAANVGGVAYVGSFNWSSDTPAFVYEDHLGNGAEKYTAEAISHEAGHTLGLSHDGTSTTGYYAGQGSGETGWAPIMGVGYYQNFTQWSQGEYADANNHQDDLAIITSQNGFGYRSDDAGNTAGTAAVLFSSSGIVSDSGIIERRSDVDVFAFNTGAGTINLQGLVAGRGADLDLLLELYDAGGRLVASANPADQLSASLSATVGAGTYYLSVSGVGKGDPLTTGYSDYASIGSYRLTGSIIETNQTFPAYLSLSAANADRSEGDSGSTAFTFTVTRTGDTSSAVSVNYALTSSQADANDFVGGLPAGTLNFAAGETSKTITILVAGDLAIESDESFTLSLANASSGAEITTGTAVGTIRNDDHPGILVSPTSGLTTSESGGTASFTVVLTSAPTADVVINVASLNTAEGVVNVSQLRFTSANWNIAQTVVVTGVDDAVRDGNQSYTVVLSPAQSSDPSYNGVDPADVQLVNQDNDKRGGHGGGGGGNTTGGGKGNLKKSPAAADSLDDGTDGEPVLGQVLTPQSPTPVTESQSTVQGTEHSKTASAKSGHSQVASQHETSNGHLDRLFTQFGPLLGELL